MHEFSAMYELAHGSLHYDSDRLDTLLFNPITDQSYFDDLLDNSIVARVSFVSFVSTLYSLQFGFRRKHSTCHSLISLTNNIASDIDQGHLAAGVFIDLSKAFDTLDHQILFCNPSRVTYQTVNSLFKIKILALSFMK
jgi:hypothetical protein